MSGTSQPGDEAAIAQLARFAGRVRKQGLTDERNHTITQHIRDLLGIALASAAEWPADPVSTVALRWGGLPEATVIGRSGRLPAANAALIGGTLGHALDFDDTHMPSVLHPSASVVPAALAASEAHGAEGAAFVRAVAVGNEITCRAGRAGYDRAGNNSIFFDRGQHATAICGAVGAAASAAMVMGLGEDLVGHAMSIATSFGSGILEANRTGGTIKRAHCGWAAHAGVTAAELAAAGLTGAPTALEGRFGFLQAFCGDGANAAALTDGLNEHWEIDHLHVKPYPINHFTHAGVDGALELRRRGVRPADIASVRLGVPEPVLRTIAEPAELKAAPPNGYAARFSGPFTFAIALSGGGGLGVFLDDLSDERVTDPVLLELAGKVHCVGDPRCNAIFPVEMPAILDVETTAGEHHHIEVLANRGGPGNPLSDAELGVKFRACAGLTLTPGRLTQLESALDDINALPSAGIIAELCSAARAA
jgi:2-methylcitrate dehydratase PrpD